MRKTIINCLVSALFLYVISILFSGFQINSVTTAIAAALVLGVVNAIIKPILHIISLPITILTLGLFSLVINAFVLLLTSAIVPGFSISGFGTALLASIVLSVLNIVFIDKEK